MLLQVKDLIQIFVEHRGEKNFLHVCIMHQASFWRAQNTVHENNGAATL